MDFVPSANQTINTENRSMIKEVHGPCVRRGKPVIEYREKLIPQKEESKAQ